MKYANMDTNQPSKRETFREESLPTISMLLLTISLLYDYACLEIRNYYMLERDSHKIDIFSLFSKKSHVLSEFRSFSSSPMFG